jgi:hypothetical protein
MDDTSHKGEHDRESRIRECAYHLWESNGKPYGRDVEFWQRARQVIAEQDEDHPPAAEAKYDATPAAVAARRRRPTAARRKPRSS